MSASSVPESEAGMRAAMTKALRAHGLHAGAVNNEACWSGTPDITYCGDVALSNLRTVKRHTTGWCEQKWLRAFPKRAETPVRFPCYTLKQREWHLDHAAAGGKITVLALVKRSWFLFDGKVAAGYLGKMAAREMHDAALVHWTGAFQLEKILEWL